MSPNVDRHRIDLDLSKFWPYGRDSGLKGDLYLGNHAGADIACLVWAVKVGDVAYWILIGSILAVRQELRLATETSDQEVAENFAQLVRPELSTENRVLWRFPDGRLLESAPTWVDGETWTHLVPQETLIALGLTRDTAGQYPSLTVSLALLKFWELNSGSVNVSRGSFGTGLGPYEDRRR